MALLLELEPVTVVDVYVCDAVELAGNAASEGIHVAPVRYQHCTMGDGMWALFVPIWGERHAAT